MTETKKTSSQPLTKIMGGAALFVALAVFLFLETTEHEESNSIFHSSSPSADTPRRPASLASNPPRLLFITLDGVRPDEFMDCKKLARRENVDTTDCSFPRLWAEIRDERFHAFPMRVGNSKNLSLPGYQSIFGGRSFDETCPSNSDCAQIPVETWLEELKRELNLRKHEVAAFSSWAPMSKAFESVKGTVFTNTGQTPYSDPTTQDEVPESLRALNEEMLKNPPQLWENARLDSYTIPYTFWYMDSIKPQVLVVSLLDSDEWGHLDRFKDYKNQLRTYDETIMGYLKMIDLIEEYRENTIVMITTDHGRGKGWFGKAFKSHGTGHFLKHSSKTWFAVSVPDRLRHRLDEIWKNFELDKKPNQHVIRKMIQTLVLNQNPLTSPLEGTKK